MKKSLNSELVLNSPLTESIYCKIHRKNNPPLIIGCVYRPPDKNLDICRLISREIYDLKSKFKKAIFWVGGDFNLPDINWEKSEISGYNNLLEINQTFLDTFNDTGLQQTVKEPTRGNNILDLPFPNQMS